MPINWSSPNMFLSTLQSSPWVPKWPCCERPLYVNTQKIWTGCSTGLLMYYCAMYRIPIVSISLSYRGRLDQ